MKLQAIQNPGIILGPTILVSLLVFWNNMAFLLPGLLYFMAAVPLSTASICANVILLKRDPEAADKTHSQSLQARANVFGLVAWQIAIIGSLNISSASLHKSLVHSLLDYMLMAVFFVSSYRILSLADSPRQKGGYRPFNFFGYPRTRRLLFAAFAGYGIVFPLTIASVEFSIGSSGWRPIAFQSSQACLLMAAIMSIFSAALILQRYHREMAEAKRSNMNVLFATLSFVVCAAVMQAVFSYRVYVYILSVIAVTGSAVAVSSLWQIGEDIHIDNGTIPNGGVSQHPVHP
jgi:hypothetical protein